MVVSFKGVAETPADVPGSFFAMMALPEKFTPPSGPEKLPNVMLVPGQVPEILMPSNVISLFELAPPALKGPDEAVTVIAFAAEIGSARDARIIAEEAIFFTAPVLQNG